MSQGIGFSIGIKATRKDAFSLGVSVFDGQEGFIERRLLRLDIGKDGSVYLTPMAQGAASWMVGAGQWNEKAASKDFDPSTLRQVAAMDEKKISFHASGYTKLGAVSTYRPPLRTISRVELMCLVHHGDPGLLPAISLDEFNAWKETKGHSLFPGIVLPGHVVATRLFIAPPKGFKEYQKFHCPDFVLFQQNLIVEVGGLPESFPQRQEGNHGYDLIIAMGNWPGTQWKGPLVLIPATGRLDDREGGRSKKSVP
jgi:hypothetical protein